MSTTDINGRIDEALRRLKAGLGAMRIPADPCDADLVLSDAKDELDALHAQLATVTRERDEARAELSMDQRDEAVRDFERWPVVLAFARAMVRKLDQHAPKKGGREGWRNDDPATLWCRVTEETGELWAALGSGGAKQQVLDEAADVANMAMMTADAAGAIDLAAGVAKAVGTRTLNAPQPPPTSGDAGPEVWPALLAERALSPELRALGEERDMMGRAKYGTPLRANNGRDALKDALQEALDLMAYLQQAIMEGGHRAGAAHRVLGPAADIAQHLLRQVTS